MNPINSINTQNDYKQLQEYQIQMANELQKLKEQLEVKPYIQHNIQEYINQINNLNAEIQQYKNINIVLNNQNEELKTKVGTVDTAKLELIENKKKEIIAELNRLKEEHANIEKSIDEQNIINQQLEDKRQSILKLIEKYDYKIFGTEHDIYINYSDMSRVDETKPIYRYILPYEYNNVYQITLVDQNFNNNMFNITPYNNKLIIGELNDYEICIDKLEDINYKFFNNNDINYLDITIEPGKYDLELLVCRLNCILNKYNIEIGYDPTRLIVQIRTKEGSNQFSLIKHEYDIYKTLGFEVTDETSNKFRGKKIADMRVCKQVDCYLLNISDKKIFSKINVSQNKITSGIMIIKPKIDKLKYLDFYFVGENGRPYWQEYDNFNMTLCIKGDINNTDKEKFIEIATIADTAEQNNLFENINKMLS